MTNTEKFRIFQLNDSSIKKDETIRPKRSTGARCKRSVIVFDFEKKVDNLAIQSLVILIEFKTHR